MPKILRRNYEIAIFVGQYLTASKLIKIIQRSPTANQTRTVKGKSVKVCYFLIICLF